MRTGRSSSGYTIVELMIVLAVSSALLVSGLLLVGGQQAKTEFDQSSHEIQSNIDQVVNNVETGYYSKVNNFTCMALASGPKFTNGTDTRGTNQDCIFVGRAIQFAVAGKPSNYSIYNLVGLRLNSSGESVTSVDQTLPTAMSPGTITNTGAFPDTTEQKVLQNGNKAIAMSYKLVKSSAPAPTSIVAFVTDFPSLGAGNNLNSDSRTADLYAITSTTSATALVTPPSLTQPDGVDKINNHGTAFARSAVNFAKVYSVTLCFGGTTNKYAIITIGGNGRELITSLKYMNSNTIPPECT